MTRLTMLVALVLPLAACFDLNQSLTVNDDRTLRYKGELAVPNLLVTLNEAQADEKFSCESDFQLVTSTGAPVTVNDFERSGNRVCQFIVETELDDVTGISLKAAGEEEAEPLMVMRRVTGGRYRISSDFTSLGNYADDSEIGEAYGAAAKTVMETLFEDRAVRWYLSAPKVINSNGDIHDDGKSVSWEVSLADLIDTDENMAFVAEIEVPQSALGRVRNFFSGIGSWFGGGDTDAADDRNAEDTSGASAKDQDEPSPPSDDGKETESLMKAPSDVE